jgi:SNF2 family DNA or RNA helicase
MGFLSSGAIQNHCGREFKGRSESGISAMLPAAKELHRFQEEAERLGMRPNFKCSAAKQRKKAYSLDPFDKKMVIPVPINRFLRRYQRTGVQFFYDRYKGIKVDGIGIVKGGILGDDMGLGKTIQVLAFVRIEAFDRAEG